MAEPFINPLKGMENEPLDTKICALMGLWVRFNKELETVFHLIQLTAIVGQQYVDEVFAEEKPKPVRRKKAKPKAKEREK